MKLGRIRQWRPFIYPYVGYDGKQQVVTFTCPKCGGHNCEKIDKSLDVDNFWSGRYRCSDCGNRGDGDGNNWICYYSRCFKHDDSLLNTKVVPVDDDDVAELCLNCEHRKTIYMLGGMPFCDSSSTTCARKHKKVRCADYKRKQPKQLSLFGDE